MKAVHAAVMDHGYALTTAAKLGLCGADFAAAFGRHLKSDPRGPGKQHARDVVTYLRRADGVQVQEALSVAFRHPDGAVTDDYSRMMILGHPAGKPVPAALLGLIPPDLARPSGKLSLDWFRYSPGTESAPHQDRFGDVVVIWVLGRHGDGAESFLLHHDGRAVFHKPLHEGDILIFRDELFQHGVTPLKGENAVRHALIAITLRDGHDG